MPRPFFGLNRNLLHVRDEKASGTAGGTFTSGAWQIRDLNTIKTNEITGVTLVTNVITGLPAGIYEVDAAAPAFFVNRHQLRLYNVTATVEILVGVSCFAASTDNGYNSSRVRGRFTLAATSNVRLEHRCETTFATQGFGVAGSFGTEVYADVQIRFLGT